MKKKIKNPIQIIAEAGVNHNGSLKNCYALINAAKRANADYVKFQSYKTEEIVLKDTPLARYQKKNLNKNLSQFKLLEKYDKTNVEFGK